MDEHRRKLVAIVFTDIVGFTEITSSDEGEAIRLLQWQRNTFQPMVEEHGGEWLKELGDGLLLSFPSSQDAVRCAIRIQEATREKPDLQIRIGIHQGDIIQEGPDILGDGVNIAARLQQIAPRGGIALSDKVQQDISGYPEFEVISLGQHSLKGVARSMEIYGLSPFGFPEIPEYRLLRLTGQGAYGEVWLAQSLTGVYRAVKIVHRDQFEDAKPYEREFTGITGYEPVSRKHEGLIDLLHVGHGQDDSFFYYVMELADDQRAREEINPREYHPRTLQSELEARGKLSIGECLEVGSRLARGLAFLHDHNLLHRDVKPANIVYVDGHPKLADIGLVTTMDNASTLVGTMGYIPPEGPGKPSSDIYALGMVLYELSTGKDRADFPEIDVLDPELRGLNQACLKACSNDLSERFANAHAFAEELDQLARGKSTPDSVASSPQTSNLKMGALAAALISILALVLYQQSGDPNEKNGEESTRNNGGKPDEPLTPDEPKSPSTNSLTNGLVAYYPFNGNAKDESGNGNDGLAANVKYVSGGFGPGGKTAEFAKGSSIKLNASKLPQGNSARTKSCFVRVTGAQPGTETAIASWGNNGSKNQTFAFFGDSFDAAPKANGFLAWSQWGSTVSFTTKENEAKQGVWYHITATFDGKTLVTYLNGNKADQKSFTLATGAGDLVIGQLDFRRILEGHVDEFRIYNRALSDENVAALYKHDIGNTEPAFLKEGLVAYYPFNGNAKDESGKNGEIENTSLKYAKDRNGKDNGALEASSGKRIDIPFKALPKALESRTLSTWIKVPQGEQKALSTVFYAGSESFNRAWMLHLTGKGITDQGGSGYLRVDANGHSTPVTKDKILDNEWRHIVWTLQGDDSKFYVNGELTNEMKFRTNTLIRRAFIGGVDGTLDELRIYNRALTEEQAKALYDWEKPKE
jgi:serine/threonine protein kinase